MTIYTLAEELGLSPSTVSRALSSPELVSEATRRRVLQKAEELGYRPNAVARALITGVTRSVAVLVPDLGNPVFAGMVAGMESVCRAARYGLLLGSFAEDPEQEEDLLRLFGEKHVDGAVVASSRIAEARLQEWAKAGLPMVLANRIPKDGRLSSVSVNHFRGGQLAAAHLLERGAREMLYLAGPAASRASLLREEGWRQQALEGGAAGVYVAPGQPTAPGGAEALATWLDGGGKMPDGIFAFNDLMAVGAIRELRRRGVRVPEDVRVVGFDDIEMAELWDPPLTTVRQPVFEMGELAARLLLEQIEEERRQPRTVLLQPQLVVRGTT